MSHPCPGSWRRFQSGSALAAPAEQSRSALLSQSVAVAADRHHVAVVQQPFENGGCHHLIAEGAAFSEGVHLVPLIDRPAVADRTLPCSCRREQLDMQMPSRWFEGQVDQFIDDQQFGLL